MKWSVLRITEKAIDEATTELKVEGLVSGDGVGVLSAACRKALARSRQVFLDLTEVTCIDRHGVGVVRQLEARGAKIRGTSAVVEALMCDE